MAKKPAGKGGARKPAASDLESRLIDAMMDLAAREGWGSVSLPAIAEGAGARLSELYPAWRSRLSVFTAFMRRIDREVVNTDFDFTPEDTVRDRLFEVLMRRFDALQPHREAIRQIRTGIIKDPAASAAMMRQLGCSMAWMLEAAGLPSDGIRGKIKIAGLSGVWLRCLAVWVVDESGDMSQTMAELDRSLKRVDRWAEILFCTGRRDTEDMAETA